jgi:hypothetical protein
MESSVAAIKQALFGSLDFDGIRANVRRGSGVLTSLSFIL